MKKLSMVVTGILLLALSTTHVEAQDSLTKGIQTDSDLRVGRSGVRPVACATAAGLQAVAATLFDAIPDTIGGSGPPEPGSALAATAADAAIGAASCLRGGPHRHTSKPVGDGMDSHHIPSKDSYLGTRLHPNDGPAIKMDLLDHKKTASHGYSKDARKYRERQRELVAQGDFMGAVDMDVKDIQSKFPGKYDDALQQMLQYAATIDLSLLRPK